MNEPPQIFCRDGLVFSQRGNPVQASPFTLFTAFSNRNEQKMRKIKIITRARKKVFYLHRTPEMVYPGANTRNTNGKFITDFMIE